MFEKVTHLPNEILGRIWNLADTEQKGELNLTEFIIAMHLIASYRDGSLSALPQVLPAGLYEAASRRRVPRPVQGSRPSSGVGSVNSIPRQFSGPGPATAPIPAAARLAYQQPQSSLIRPAEEWAINQQEKDEFDRVFSTVDKANRGFVTGDQAVAFFRNSKLPEDTLAQIWDLADVNSEGQLSRDEFAVAMFLIRAQRAQRDGRDVLPKTLPLNLIPPSMRHQPRPIPQTLASATDNVVNTSTSKSGSDELYGVSASKPASDDLFGLDAWSYPGTQIAQTTGDSGLYSATPPPIQGSPQPAHQPHQPQSSSAFKPFIPSSSFGRNMITPQSTGPNPLSKPTGSSNRDSPALNRNTHQQSPMDDLLGDNDPEVSRKLTQETTELANLSNQVSNLTGQMQAVKTNRMSTEQDLSNAQLQKRDFESRLSQLRSAYEQEVKIVKMLEEQLSSIRIETKKLDQDMASTKVAHQNLQNQHGQLEKSIQLDQRENAELKERIRQTNVETNELKPQLEKMKSEARQQKGLVAINKKQLATNESDLERIKVETEGVSKELEEAKREAEETRRLLEKGSHAKAIAGPTSPSSNTSMNPFLRRAPSVSEKSVGSQSTAQNLASPNHNAFENFFGPSLVSSHSQSGPPPISFMSDSLSGYKEPSQRELTSEHSVKSSDGPDLRTPSDSPPPSTYNDIPQLVGEPPAPPQSRQITSSILPLQFLHRSESTSSSIKVVPPASRRGEPVDFDTPTERKTSFSAPPEPDVLRKQLDIADAELKGSNNQQPMQPAAEQGLSGPWQNIEDENRSLRDEDIHTFEKPSSFQKTPGAFPTELSAQSQPSTLHNTSGTLSDSMEVSSTRAQNPSPGAHGPLQISGAAQDDLNTAFNGFGDKGKIRETSNRSAPSGEFSSTGSPQNRGEFPPIQNIGADDESDTDSDRGFDDNFTAASPQRPLNNLNEVQPLFSKDRPSGSDDVGATPTRPPILSSESNQTQLPSPGAQMSPPTYDQTVFPNGQSAKRKDSNQFPAEYIGLLPSREILNTPPMSPPGPGLDKAGSPTVNEKGTGLFGGPIMGEPLGGSTSSSGPLPLAPGASAAPYAYDHNAPIVNQHQPPVPAKIAPVDDFDNEFVDLSEAKEADDKIDDEFGSVRKDGFDEFNPVFDSPAPSRSVTHPTSNADQNYNNFHDFETNLAASSTSFNSRQPTDQNLSNQSHDWDAMLAGLNPTQKDGLQQESQRVQVSNAEQTKPQAALPEFEPKKPALSRMVSTGTEHDDPILKRLTGLGYPREASLKALEKFDYNIDKASLPMIRNYANANYLKLIGRRLSNFQLLIPHRRKGSFIPPFCKNYILNF